MAKTILFPVLFCSLFCTQETSELSMLLSRDKEPGVYFLKQPIDLTFRIIKAEGELLQPRTSDKFIAKLVSVERSKSGDTFLRLTSGIRPVRLESKIPTPEKLTDLKELKAITDNFGKPDYTRTILEGKSEVNQYQITYQTWNRFSQETDQIRIVEIVLRSSRTSSLREFVDSTINIRISESVVTLKN